MTDIVERLREQAQFFRGSCEWPATANAFAEATDEIERLRAAVHLGVEMRTRQKTYFKTRDRGDLIASKQAEADFDEAALGDKP